MARLLGVDYGERRIGLALSDPTSTIASPLTTLWRRPGKRPPWAELERLVQDNEVEGIVVGLPIDLAGEEGEWAREVRDFGANLERRTGKPIHWIDERMSSVLAERLVRSSGLRRGQREEKERVDATAAAIILQNYLERLRKDENEGDDDNDRG
jgi:putative holliday junction resolvase